jgi:hypothetical protein
VGKGEAPLDAGHRDDEFHPPTSEDPFWTETCWFTFTVPERRLSGQFYPFFRPNQGVVSAAAYFWDPTSTTTADARHARHFWHLPIPDQPLSDISLANGISYRCVEPLQRYELTYRDPDAGPGPAGYPTDGSPGEQAGPGPEDRDPASRISAELTFTAIAPPNYLGGSHLDQPGRYEGTIVLDGETIPVDSFGFRDRSWGSRSQFGPGIHGTSSASGGYSYATASDRHAFHAITMDVGTDGAFGTEGLAIHGYLLRDGTWSKVTSGTRRVLERHPRTSYPSAVALDLTDESGRELHAEGRCLNGLGLFLNPNLYTVNCLTEWTFDGITAFGEDHDNWSATGIRDFLRSRRAEPATTSSATTSSAATDRPSSAFADPLSDPATRPTTHEVPTR